MVTSEVSDGSLLLLVAFLLVKAPNCHLSLVLVSVVQGDAVMCSTVTDISLSPCCVVITMVNV